MKPITNKEREKISKDLIDEMTVESEANVLMLLNSSEDFIFILDKEGNIINVNTAVLKALKYSEKELLRMNVLDLHPPEQRKTAMSTVRELIKGKRKSLMAPFVTKDNKEIYIEAILTRGRWKDRDVFIGICRDITERKRIERLLKESDKKLISLLEYSNDLFAIVNDKFEYEYINEDVYQDVLGYSKEELLGKARIDIIHPDDLKKAMEGARIGFKTGEYKSIIRIKTKEGKWLWIESRGKTFIDKEGNRKAFLTGRNITDKIIAEQRLRESGNKFQNLISNMSDVLVEMDEQGTIIFISPQTLEMFGFKPEELIGKNFSKYVHPKDLKIIRNKIRKSLNSLDAVTFEYRALHKTGKYITVSVKGNKVIDDGKLRYIGVLRDLTEQIEAEKRLKEIEEDKRRLKKITQIEPEIRFWKLIQPKKDITVVQKTRRMLETVIDNIPIFIYWKDLDLNYLGCNEVFAHLTHHESPNNIIGKNSQEIPILADIAKIIDKLENQVIQNGVPVFNIIESWKLDDNKKFWFNINRIPLFDEKLNVNGILVTANDITEKKIAEQKLKESEENFRKMIDFSYDIISIMSTDGKILYQSPSCERIFGYSPNEMIDTSAYDYIHPDDKSHVIRTLAEGLRSDLKIGRVECRYKHKNGEWRYVEAIGSNLFEYNGVESIIVNTRDITDRKIIEQKLTESEEKYRLITENANDFLAVLNEKFEYEFINEATYLRCLGYSNEDLLGKQNFDLVHPEDKESSLELLKDGFLSGEGNVETRIKTKEGDYKWVEVKGQTFHTTNNEKKALLITRDITERKIAEQKIFESEKNFRTIAEQSLYGMTIFQDNRIQYINKQGAKTLEYLQEEMVGWSIKDILKVIHPEDRDLVLEQNQKIMTRSDDALTDGYYRVITKTGKIKHMESATTWITYQGNPAMLTTTQDITEKKLSEKKLKESEAKYRILFDHSPIGIGLSTKEGRVIASNQKMREITGYSDEELRKINIVNTYVDLNDRKELMKIIKDTGMIRGFETKLKKKNGSVYTARLNIDLLKIENEDIYLTICEDITERKAIEQELERSEREISALLNNIPDVIITVDQDKRIQFVNHIPLSIPKDEIIGQDIYSFLEHEHQDILKESFKRVFSSGISETIELLAFTNLWYIARFIPVKRDNETVSVILIATNITDTKITSEKLKKTEDRLTSILDSSGDLFSIVDDKFKFEYINEESYIKTLGYSNEDLIGKQRLDILHPEDLEKAMKAGLFQKLGQGQVVDYELRTKANNGEWRHIDSRGQKFIDEDGKTKYFLIGRDITFRKQAEQKIKESEEKYRHLFENSPNAIVLVSLKGVVMDCNPATTALFGYEKEDLINKKFSEIAAYPSELKPQLINNFKQISKRDYKVPFEFQAFKKDGTIVWVASYLALNRLGPETFVQAIFQDITQQKKSKRIIQKEIERLKEIDQIRNDLVRRISHELKTPLISIYSTSQHLLQNYSGQVDKRIMRLINTIHKGGKRLKVLAENLVNSLRLESQELMLTPQNENLVEIVSDCIDTFAIFAKERNIFFKKELPEKIMLDVDKIWLSQAISNLISNAIKNTPKRGGVLVKISEDNNNVDIKIEDTGVGLTKKERKKLFEKFGKIERFNEDLDIDIEGSGLGLYISREIVQLHGGKILAESRGRNLGSIFTIRLFKNRKNS